MAWFSSYGPLYQQSTIVPVVKQALGLFNYPRVACVEDFSDFLEELVSTADYAAISTCYEAIDFTVNWYYVNGLKTDCVLLQYLAIIQQIITVNWYYGQNALKTQAAFAGTVYLEADRYLLTTLPLAFTIVTDNNLEVDQPVCTVNAPVRRNPYLNSVKVKDGEYAGLVCFEADRYQLVWQVGGAALEAHYAGTDSLVEAARYQLVWQSGGTALDAYYAGTIWVEAVTSLPTYFSPSAPLTSSFVGSVSAQA